jgi:hypothetical protein
MPRMREMSRTVFLMQKGSKLFGGRKWVHVSSSSSTCRFYSVWNVIEVGILDIWTIHKTKHLRKNYLFFNFRINIYQHLARSNHQIKCLLKAWRYL